MKTFFLVLVGVILLTSCAGFDAAMDIADIITGDPVIHTGVVESVTTEFDATVDPPERVTVIVFEDGYSARLPGYELAIPGDDYALRESDTRGYYLERP